MGRKNISAVISLKDNMSATLRGIRNEQKAFGREVDAQTQKIRDNRAEALKQRNELKKARTLRLNATKAHAEITKLRNKLEPLRKKTAKLVAIKTTGIEKVDNAKKKLDTLGRKVAKPVVQVKDKATSIIKKIASGLTSLKGIAATVGIGKAVAGALGEGATLEKQQISMNHFMGVGNKGKSQSQISKMSNRYLKSLRNNANNTPFETGEVIAAGTRALQVEKGNTRKAMSMVKLAEDMAAMNPGKTVGDAMEALADMKIGEMSRLAEFGIKASSTDNPADVQKQLEAMYNGGAGKLAQSGSGLGSTIIGKAKSMVADTGLAALQAMVPALKGVISLLDSAAPGVQAFGTAIGQGIGGAISFLQSRSATLAPIFQNAFMGMQSIITSAGPIISEGIKALWPVFEGLLSIGGVAFRGIGAIVQAVAPLVVTLLKGISPVLKDIGSVLKNVGSIFNKVFNGIRTVVKKAVNAISPLLNTLANGLSRITNAVSSGFSWVTNKIGRNATGTKYWTGGLSIVGEHGPELVDMPNGSKVYTNSETNAMLHNSRMASAPPVRGGSGKSVVEVVIKKIADTVIINDDMDINDFVEKFVAMLKIALLNFAG